MLIAENRRLRGDETLPKGMIPDAENSPSQPIDFIDRKFGLRGDGPFEWTACNEVTRKLTAKGSHDAVAWAMLVGGQGWYGRIGEEFLFGPSTVRRAEAAVEARLLGQMFDKLEGEKSWSGTCWRLLSGFEAPEDTASSSAAGTSDLEDWSQLSHGPCDSVNSLRRRGSCLTVRRSHPTCPALGRASSETNNTIR